MSEPGPGRAADGAGRVPSPTAPAAGRSPRDDAPPMVEAEQVHKYFGAAHVLTGIDLRVRRSEVMCIVGPSGSGKSTFLRCVNHLETFDSGRLSVDGELVGMICRRRPPWQPTLSYGRACRRCGVS
jgi:ABC-type glutathione transport system ATPase component